MATRMGVVDKANCRMYHYAPSDPRLAAAILLGAPCQMSANLGAAACFREPEGHARRDEPAWSEANRLRL